MEKGIASPFTAKALLDHSWFCDALSSSQSCATTMSWMGLAWPWSSPAAGIGTELDGGLHEATDEAAGTRVK